MAIHQLVQFCADTYNRNGRCADCPNTQCLCNDETCEKCLGNIHNFKKCDRSYACCPNITLYYTGKFIYRYSSEIEYVLNSCRGFFEANQQPLNVCSIGCGPSTELFGLESFLRRNGINREVTYTGFDFITTWMPIHDKIKELLPNYQISYCHTDCFDFYRQEGQNQLPNVIIMNYLLSDILTKQGIDTTNRFIDDFCDFFATLPSALLVVNDINLGKPNVKGVFSQVIAGIVARYPNTTVEKFSFPLEPEEQWMSYGETHPVKTITTIPEPHILTMFKPRNECGSAQFILHKQ